MRILSLILIYIFSSCVSVSKKLSPENNFLCKECREKFYITVIGTCELCNGYTSSSAFKYCSTCAYNLNRCQFCLKKM